MYDSVLNLLLKYYFNPAKNVKNHSNSFKVLNEGVSIK